MPATDRRGPLLLAVLLFLTAFPIPSPAAAAAPAAVALEAIPGEGWEGLQFLGADTRGRVFLLRGETLEVHSLGEAGPGDPVALEERSAATGPGKVLSAAMGSSSGDWLVRSSAFRVRWFRGGEEVPLPETGWLVQNVVLANGDPVLAVAPVEGAGAFATEGPVPRLLELAGRDWQTRVEAEPPADPRLTSEDPEVRLAGQRELRWETAVALAAGRQGRVWMADRHAFRLREYSPAGRLLTTVTLGADPRMEIVERPAEEREAIREAAAAAGRPLPDRLPGFGVRPRPVLRGMTVADGRVYLLADVPLADAPLADAPARDGEGDGVALVRWDPVRQALEHVRLSAGALPAGTVHLAPGRHALYLAAVAARGTSRFHIPWASLDAADWQPLGETVYLDGSPLPRAPPPPPDSTPEKAGFAAQGS